VLLSSLLSVPQCNIITGISRTTGPLADVKDINTTLNYITDMDISLSYKIYQITLVSKSKVKFYEVTINMDGLSNSLKNAKYSLIRHVH